MASRLEKVLSNHRDESFFLQYAKNITSQGGEDGILTEIFTLIGVSKGYCVDIGAWDGVHLSNTYNLLQNNNWSGLLIEADDERSSKCSKLYTNRTDVVCVKELVTIKGLNSLYQIFQRYKITNDIDFLCIDIDGADYYLWATLDSSYRPKVICIEFNPTIPNHILFVQQADTRIHQGSSLLAFVELGKQKNYSLLVTTTFNAIFIDNKYLSTIPKFDNSIHTLHSQAMVTDLFQTYDGELKLVGPKKLLWHRKPINIQKFQCLRPKDRIYPFAPSSSNQISEYLNLYKKLKCICTPLLKLNRRIDRGDSYENNNDNLLLLSNKIDINMIENDNHITTDNLLSEQSSTNILNTINIIRELVQSLTNDELGLNLFRLVHFRWIVIDILERTVTMLLLLLLVSLGAITSMTLDEDGDTNGLLTKTAADCLLVLSRCLESLVKQLTYNVDSDCILHLHRLNIYAITVTATMTQQRQQLFIDVPYCSRDTSTSMDTSEVGEGGDDHKNTSTSICSTGIATEVQQCTSRVGLALSHACRQNYTTHSISGNNGSGGGDLVESLYWLCMTGTSSTSSSTSSSRCIPSTDRMIVFNKEVYKWYMKALKYILIESTAEELYIPIKSDTSTSTGNDGICTTSTSTTGREDDSYNSDNNEKVTEANNMIHENAINPLSHVNNININENIGGNYQIYTKKNVENNFCNDEKSIKSKNTNAMIASNSYMQALTIGFGLGTISSVVVVTFFVFIFRKP